MPNNRQELLFPFGGLNDSEAASDQPDGTTIEVVNMRPFDPTNGKRRGSQRSGLSKYSSALVSGSSRIQSIVPVQYDKTRINYSVLDAPTKEWEVITPSFGTGFSVVTDADGNIYVLDGVNAVVKYNPDGVKLDAVVLPTYTNESVVERLVLDEFKSFYVGLRGNVGSRIIKYTLDEERGYLQSWSLILAGELRDFSVNSDVLVASIDRLEDNTGQTASVVTYIGTSFSTAPVLAWEKDIPGPVNGLAVTSTAIYYTSKANDSRGLLDDTYYYNSVKWSPTELTTATQRFHYWLDASNFVDAGYDAVNGERINFNIESIVERSDYASFTAVDQTSRKLKKPSAAQMAVGGSSINMTRKAPFYETQVWGTYPALSFLGSNAAANGVNGNDNYEDRVQNREGRGNVLVSEANDVSGADPYNNTKDGVDGSLDANKCAIPGQKDQRYIFAMVGRIKDWSDNPSVVFTAQDEGTTLADQNQSISLLVNVGDNGKTRDEGKITFHIKNGVFDASGSTADCEPFDLKAISPSGDFILVYTIDNGTGKSAVRINGRALDCMTVNQTGEDIQMQGPETVSEPGAFGNARQHTGRFVLGGPAQGFTLGEFDNLWSSGSSTARVLDNDENGWTTGVPNFCSHKIVQADLSDAGYLGYGPVGSPTADSTVFDSGTDGADSPVGNMEFFNGYIGEVVTILAGHDSGVNNAAISQPMTSASKAPVRGDAANSQNTAAATEVEKIEGYLAWKWGIPFVLPADDSAGATANGLYTGHVYKTAAPASGGSVDVVGYDDSDYNSKTRSPEALTGKLSLTGEGRWLCSGAGMGYGIAANDDGDVVTVGPLSSDARNPDTGVSEPWVQARKLIDKGSTFSGKEEDGAWAFSEPIEHLNYTITYEYPRIALDTDGNVYWPIKATSKGQHVRKLNTDDGSLDWEYSLNTAQQTYAIALPPTRPEYNDDSIKSPEFAYISADNGSTNTLPQLTKIRLVQAEQNIDEGFTTRETKLVAVADGDVKVITSSASTSATDGDDALASNGVYISGVAAFQKIYFTDGISYKVYDPTTDTVSNWTASKSGEIPKRNKLLALWRGRMVIARDPDDPHNWHMSAMGDPDDWDQNPPLPVATQSISGNNARAGKLADVVNALIPYSDDLLLFGCDSKIYRLTGDPMAGGQLDLVSETTGVAFGKSWCKDPEGVIYFFGSRGGVYAMTPTGEIQNISGPKIERRLQEFDLDRYRIELVWNDVEQGLHLIQVPYSYHAIQLTSWYWDRRHNAWFEDELSTASKQFTSMAVMDGDKYDDRGVVIGCEDGYVRQWDRNKDDDDGSRIHSRVLIGPVTDEASSSDFRFGKVQIELAGEQNGADFDFFTSRAADKRGEPIRSGELHSGSNGIISGTQRGSSAWIRLKNGADNERWALESASIALYSAGRKRLR